MVEGVVIDVEAVYEGAEMAAGVAFADAFPEVRGDVPDEFAESFESALREYVALSIAGKTGPGHWRNDSATRLAVYPELRERFDAAVRHALDAAAFHVAKCLRLPAPPAPTEALVSAARNLWAAYLAFNVDPGPVQ